MPRSLKSVFLALLFLFFCLNFALAEDITITSYYPSPYGVYRELRSQRVAIGDNYINGGSYDWEAADGDGGEIDYLADLVIEGSVGIGTVTPAKTLEIKGTHYTAQARLFSDHYGQGLNGVNTAVMSLWASEPGWTWQGVGIGNNINGSPYYGRVTNTRGGSWLRLLDNAIALHTVNSSGTDMSGIDISNGNVGIGMGSSTAKLAVSGALESVATPTGDINSAGLILRDETTTTRWQVHSHGNVLRMWNGSTETIVGDQTSSIRFKENVQPLTSILEKINQLNPVSFKYKPDYYDGRQSLGLIAEEAVGVFPEIVSLDEGKQPYAINYGLLSVVAIKGIQEQQQKIEELSGKMIKLSQENRDLRKSSAELELKLNNLEIRLSRLEEKVK